MIEVIKIKDGVQTVVSIQKSVMKEIEAGQVQLPKGVKYEFGSKKEIEDLKAKAKAAKSAAAKKADSKK